MLKDPEMTLFYCVLNEQKVDYRFGAYAILFGGEEATWN